MGESGYSPYTLPYILHFTRNLPVPRDAVRLLHYSILCSSVFFTLCIFTFPQIAVAQNFFIKDTIKDIKHAIDRPLPKLSEILGHDIDMAPAPIVAIGFLENHNLTDNKDWGKAIGWYLMEATNGMTTDIAVLPSFQYLSDGLVNTRNSSDDRKQYARRAAKRTGAKYIVTGDVEVNTDDLKIDIEITDSSTGTGIANINETVQKASLQSSLANIASKILKLLIKHENPATSVASLNPALPAEHEIESLAEAFSKSSDLNLDEKADHYEDLWLGHSEFLTSGTLFLNALDTIYDDDRLRKYLPLIISNDKTTPTLKIYSYMLASRVELTGGHQSQIDELKQLLISNPNNLYSWIALDLALTHEDVMYHRDEAGVTHIVSSAIDHDPGRSQSIVVSMEMLKRWPDYYRAWWSLGDTLNNYAGLVRGTNYWNQIPDDVKSRYRRILKVADNSMFQALRRHPAQGVMYINLISLDVAFSRDWMSSFRRAAELAPHNHYTYEVAFNYAQPQWGGTKDNQKEIYRLARDNNPGREWPQKLRDIWAPEIKPIIDFENPRSVLLLFVILIFIVFVSVKLYLNRINR
jgi:succinate dehydrogenase flavin-adding protein (antitoxin of CptAB toxin-antitoxin module)